MSTTFCLQSRLTAHNGVGLVVDVSEGGADTPADGARLDVNVQAGGPDGLIKPSQLWQAVRDADFPGYFNIVSLQKATDGNPLVMDIAGIRSASDMRDGVDVVAFRQHSGFHDNQLWTISLDPGAVVNDGSGESAFRINYFLIESKLTTSSGLPYVLDVQGWEPGHSPALGTFLDAFHKKSTDNQLWQMDFPFGPPNTSPEIGFFSFDPATESVTVGGSGFRPAQTLALGSALVVQGGQDPALQVTPQLALTDLGGVFSATASLADWGFGLGDEGEFTVTASDNQNGTNSPFIAQGSRTWGANGIPQFTNG